MPRRWWLCPERGDEHEFIDVLTERRGLQGQQTSHVLSHVDTRTRVECCASYTSADYRPIPFAASDSEPDTVHVRLPSCPSSDVDDE